jgi:predicted CoA-binding protein
MRDDGRVKPVASIRRGMNRVVDALKGKGVECVEVEPKWFEESWELIVCHNQSEELMIDFIVLYRRREEAEGYIG